MVIILYKEKETLTMNKQKKMTTLKIIRFYENCLFLNIIIFFFFWNKKNEEKEIKSEIFNMTNQMQK